MPEILVIEDSKSLADVICRELEQAGFKTLIAYDGETGLQLIRERNPDFIILDWMLPGKSGLDILHELGDNRLMPVLMLTARSEEADRVIGLELGADDYLTKPFSMRELLARVRAMLRRHERIQEILRNDQTPASGQLDWGAIHIDPARYYAAKDGIDLELTRTEFALLCLFIRNPRRVFSRAYLLETVWGETYIEGDRSVDNAILRLRKKLGDQGEAIETVWGMGYRLKGKQ
ncbi:MAG: response regulator transcription factor [Chloroflexi bacterium]|jgi:DNA-binding response OmpR family regulator|nr:response regulator transcription factor [Chloroflexota bacterium]